MTANFVRPYSVAVHRDGGTIYWVDYDAGTIGKVNTDGSDRTMVLEGLSFPAA